jgi:hypothetical protein
MLASLFMLLPAIASAQAQSSAGEAGFKTGYLIGFFAPIIVIVGVVVWLAWLIFRKPRPPRDKHRSGW